MRILVSGLINLETTLRIEGFPIPYDPVRYPFFGVHSTVSGVGYNVAKALTTLGHEVRLLAMIGDDAAGGLVRAALTRDALPAADVLPLLDETPQSVILYDSEGRRQIHVDLKDIQETAYPPARVTFDDCDLAVLCNINFSRPLLAQAKTAGVRIATDVHAIASLDDAYNGDFMASADILFMSHEHLPVRPDAWARAVHDRFGAKIVVIGLGADGALLLTPDGTLTHVPAVQVRPIVSTIGAGDALFSAFLHAYGQSEDAHAALRTAVVFAGYKIGAAGAAEGFLDAKALAAL